MKPLLLAALATILSCSNDDPPPVDGGVADGGGADGDATAARSVWSSDATKVVATARGGFWPTPPAGSDCIYVDATYTLSVATRTLEWRTCHADFSGAPFRWEVGAKTLPDDRFDALVAALKAVVVSTDRVCSLDNAELALTVSTATTETKYIDRFWGCGPEASARTSVDNINPVFQLLQEVHPHAPTADAGSD